MAWSALSHLAFQNLRSQLDQIDVAYYSVELRLQERELTGEGGPRPAKGKAHFG